MKRDISIYKQNLNAFMSMVMHYIVLHTLPLQGDAYYSVDLFLRPAIAIGMCPALYWIMSKATPWTLGILTGGRAKTNTTYA